MASIFGILSRTSFFLAQGFRKWPSRGFNHPTIEKLGGGEAMSKITKTYDYLDEAGNLIFQVVRYEQKDFRQRRPDGNGGWYWNLNDVHRVPYRLPELLRASKQDWFFIAEGEKDIDRLYNEGMSATCNSGGAGKWQNEYNRHFEGRLIAILPDSHMKFDGSIAWVNLHNPTKRP
jgi:hypothetical protein